MKTFFQLTTNDETVILIDSESIVAIEVGKDQQGCYVYCAGNPKPFLTNISAQVLTRKMAEFMMVEFKKV